MNGKLFACYYTVSPSGNGSSSNAMKEGELMITTALSSRARPNTTARSSKGASSADPRR